MQTPAAEPKSDDAAFKAAMQRVQQATDRLDAVTAITLIPTEPKAIADVDAALRRLSEDHLH